MDDLRAVMDAAGMDRPRCWAYQKAVRCRRSSLLPIPTGVAR